MCQSLVLHYATETTPTFNDEDLILEKTLKRTLKIQDVGDFYKNGVVPQILLKGKWLTEAGFYPDSKVEVISKARGTLEIVIKSEREVS